MIRTWFLWCVVFMLCSQCVAVSARKKRKARPSRPKIVRKGTTSPSSFTPDMPFGHAIHILRHATNPPVNIVVLWKDLKDNADIDAFTPIGMDGVSGVTLRTHLELLLQAVAGGGPRLGHKVRGNAIVIGLQENLRVRLIARIYDIRDIVQSPSLGFAPFAGRPMMSFPMASPMTPAIANTPAANRQ
jgi:hypothetical protein